MRWKRAERVLVAATSVALCAAVAPSSSAGRFGGKGWDDPVVISRTQASLEISLAINPRDERQLAVCGPAGFPAVADGQSYFHRSVDGGRRWSYLDVETAATDTRSAAFEGGDCDVAYDAGGTLWVADTWLGNLSIGHSRDGRTFQGSAVTTTAPVVDRPWLVGGPPGTLYVTYQDLQCCTPSVVWFTRTTDYGTTFTSPVPVTTATPAGAYTWQGNLAVAPGGRDLYLVYSRRSLPVQLSGTLTIAVAASHDGGATWTSRHVANLPNDTSSLYPSMAVDAGGRLHAVWSLERNGDMPVFYTTSKDRGMTWSRPRALNPGGGAVAPWVAGGKKGQARIGWLGTPLHTHGGWEAYFHYAKVDDGRTVGSGPTTTRPIFIGSVSTPEFGMVRLDRQGRLHLAMAVQLGGTRTTSGRWAFYYQRETGR